MEKRLPVDDKTYESPDVTLIDDQRTQWKFTPREGSILTIFLSAETPDVLEITASDDTAAAIVHNLRFTIETQGPSQENPEDVNEGRVRSTIIALCLIYRQSNPQFSK